MSWKKLSIIFILFLALAGGIFAYRYLSSTFNGQNLKAIDVKFVNDENSSEVNAQDHLLLSAEERSQLVLALNSAVTTEVNPQQITHRYNMDLHNNWGFSKEYTVLFTENTTVFLQEQGSQAYYKVEKPGFFYSYPEFEYIYSQRLMPAIEVTLNEGQILFTNVDKHWSYQRYDGEWAEQNLDSSKEAVNNDKVTVKSWEDKLAAGTANVPDHALLKIIEPSTERVIYEEEVVDLSQLPFPDMNGSFSYELTMEWINETKPYRGEYVIKIPVVVGLPEKFVFSKEKLTQGDILEVSVYHTENPEDIFFEQSIYQDFRWYQQEGFIRGYLPTNYNTEPGKYQIKYGNRKNGTEFSREFEVFAHNYQIQHLVIDEQIEQETRNDAAYEEFAKYFTPVRKKSAPNRFYTESFILPTKGRLTTEFGQTRYVNGAPTSSRHSGLDIAAPTGTEIRATNRGKVVLAMELMLTGNTIVIDHGEGLFSVYYHAHEKFVAAGEIVERGQKIASVGTTGFSTGPHLHFTMSYYLMNIEPGFFLVGQPITYANYREFL